LPFLFVQQSFVLFSVFLCYILLQPWLYTQILGLFLNMTDWVIIRGKNFVYI
jgi:hypothetical protein